MQFVRLVLCGAGGKVGNPRAKLCHSWPSTQPFCRRNKTPVLKVVVTKHIGTAGTQGRGAVAYVAHLGVGGGERRAWEEAWWLAGGAKVLTMVSTQANCGVRRRLRRAAQHQPRMAFPEDGLPGRGLATSQRVFG